MSIPNITAEWADAHERHSAEFREEFTEIGCPHCYKELRATQKALQAAESLKHQMTYGYTIL